MLTFRVSSTRSLSTLLALLIACSSTTPSPTPSNSNEGNKSPAVPGLEQRVALTPAEPRSGQDVQIHSVITNTGNAAVTVQSRICGLDLGGELALRSAIGVIACSGHSAAASIAPGESVQSTEVRRVASPPGTYTLRVRHSLKPEMWKEVNVVVRP